MSVTVRYVADPPQWKERGIGVESYNTAYSVGDRFSIVNSTYAGGATFECTTAGTSDFSSFSPTASPFVWGTSVWTLVTSDSWAKAATRAFPNVVNYVDCDSTYPNMTLTSCVVFVEPTTMQPRNGRSITDRTGGYPSFYGGNFSSTYHSRKRFGDPSTAYDTSSSPVRIDFDATHGAQNAFLSECRGGRFVSSRAGAGVIVYGGGSALRIEAPTVTAVTDSPLLSEAVRHRRTFGMHVEHNTGSNEFAGMGGTFSTTGAFLLTQDPDGYRSNNAYPPGLGMGGSLCAFQKTTTTYRDGAAGSLEAFSLSFGGHKNASYGAHWMSPFLYHYNTLTGSRTVTLHFITDSPHNKSLTDADIWLDCFYPSSNTTAQYSLATTENANWGAPACSKTVLSLATGETWTAPSIFYATAWKLSVTVSIQRAGYLMLRLIVASKKISRNVTFVCPYIGVA